MYKEATENILGNLESIRQQLVKILGTEVVIHTINLGETSIYIHLVAPNKTLKIHRESQMIQLDNMTMVIDYGSLGPIGVHISSSR